MHNAAFAKLKIKALYIPFSVEPKALKKTLKVLKASGLSGFNVTIPYKSACIKQLDKTDKLASMIGAVNTVVARKDKLVGYNTDATGFIKSVKEELKINIKNKTCYLVGAGGAGRAVGFALAKEGAKEIYIKDVARTKAISLARNIKKHFPGCKVFSDFRLQTSDFRPIDLLVNATPLGMKKNDPLPIDMKLLNKTKAVYDVIYNRQTELVKYARKRKIKAVNGLGMLLYQGAEALELWTNKKAPIGVMRRALLENMK